MKISSVIKSVSKWNPRRLNGDAEFTYIDLGSINQEEKRIESTVNIASSRAPSRARQIVKEGDVLVSTVRPNLNGVAMVPPELDGATASTGFCVLRPNEKINKNYLFHWVQTSRFVDDMCAKSTGQSYPAVSDRIVKESPMAVPGLDVQYQISEALINADTARSQRRKSLELLDELTQSIFLDMFGDPRAPGSQWESINFSEALTASPRNGLSPSKGGGFSASVLTLSSVTGESFNPDAQKEATFKEAPPSEKSVRRNDFLVCRGNGNIDLVGRGHFPTEDMPNMTFPDTIIASPVDQGKLSPKFLETLWKQNSTREQIKSVARTTNGTFKINQRSLESIRIIVPPIGLQWEFSEKVRKIEEAKTKHLAHLAHLDELFSSVQQRAFDGTLWDDPTVTS